MKEWLIDLYPIQIGVPTKVRVFAANQAQALKVAKEMYPQYKPGSIKQISN